MQNAARGSRQQGPPIRVCDAAATLLPHVAAAARRHDLVKPKVYERLLRKILQVGTRARARVCVCVCECVCVCVGGGGEGCLTILEGGLSAGGGPPDAAAQGTGRGS